MGVQMVYENVVAYFPHLHTSSQHDYSFNLVLTHHPPEVLHRLFQRTFINIQDGFKLWFFLITYTDKYS
ncbi:hypothetical protein GBAR_LOCUS20610 [Geodia barretti]|uniref:Uncharacterized protein n=1 Tax=Geodia barretti TaxID=519541 RepID=A0AA35SVC8_GEOBA|nr:hypothetical protein GBAR_LOCUS20610 [Geodia barretti]